MTHSEKELILTKLNFIAVHISLLQAIHENIKSRQELTKRILEYSGKIELVKRGVSNVSVN